MKRLTFASLMGALAVLGAMSEPVKIDGVYYNLPTSADGEATLIDAPETDPYSGVMVIPSTVAYEGTTYKVMTMSTITGPKVTELTVEDGVNIKGLTLSDFTSLEKLTIPASLKEIESRALSSRVSFAYSPAEKCAYATVYVSGPGTTQFNTGNNVWEGECTLSLPVWNVYYTDGTKMEPVLYNEYASTVIRPGVDNTFTVEASRMSASGILPLTGAGYYVVSLTDAENPYGFTIRLQPSIGTTGKYVDKGGIRYSIDGTTAMVYGLSPAGIGEGAGKDLTIESALTYDGKSYPVATVAAKAFADTDFRSIILPEGITSIGKEAFAYNSSLTTVKLPATLTTSPTGLVAGSWFAGCSALEEAEIPAGVTHMSGTFINCTSLRRVTVPNTVKDFSSTFTNCHSLEPFDLNTDGMYRYSFTGCDKFLSVETTVEGDVMKVKADNGFIYDGGKPVPLMMYLLIDASSKLYDYFRPDGDGVYSIPMKYIEEAPGNVVTLSVYVDSEQITPFLNVSGDGFNPIYCFTTVTVPQPTSGVSGVCAESASPIEYYTLQGVRVDAPRQGVYIKRQGASATKVVIR